MSIQDSLKNINFKDRVLACPAMGKTTRFQLVDEFGSGEPYAGLAFEVTDSEDLKYKGFLNANGTGEVKNHCAGAIALTFNTAYHGTIETYTNLMGREHYPLPITELQVRAEQTRYFKKDGSRTHVKPLSISGTDEYCQVEVRQLVKHVSHLPPKVQCHFPLNVADRRLMGRFGTQGVCIAPQRLTVLEVRPLRALRPLLSTTPEFCALNLYQLALMATLSYCPFGQEPDEQPVTTPRVSFKHEPSVGNWFGDKLAAFMENWQVNPEQTQPYYPFYEEVPYSERLEIVPFDPALYPPNNPLLGPIQENPASIHFLDDTQEGREGTDTQAFVTHNHSIILIAVRGTSAAPDFLRDADALQVPFEEGEGKVHRGFYEAAKVASTFILKYLDRFHTGQKVLICGHSLGGAIALLLSQMLLCRKGFDYDVLLYTYGAPRAADATFINAAASLVHHRMVNHNDPIPSVPATWMNTKSAVYGSGAVLAFANAPAGLSLFAAGLANLTGEPYQHHGTLRHFMPVDFGQGTVSHIMWQPLCDTAVQHAVCSVAVGYKDGLPERGTFLRQLFDMAQHYMVDSYIPRCWAALKRYMEALETQNPLVTRVEYTFVSRGLEQIQRDLRAAFKDSQNRPDKYREAHKDMNLRLIKEVENITHTVKRLYPLSLKPVTGADVYGHFAEQPEHLNECVERWLAHTENHRTEQLAMLPEPRKEMFRFSSLKDPLLNAETITGCFTGDILDLG
ncbi:lipase family protein [Pseudomonas saxonica]|nr:lipase family protein [Pseudomonas saxonica]